MATMASGKCSGYPVLRGVTVPRDRQWLANEFFRSFGQTWDCSHPGANGRLEIYLDGEKILTEGGGRKYPDLARVRQLKQVIQAR